MTTFSDCKKNKGSILKNSVEYISALQRENQCYADLYNETNLANSVIDRLVKRIQVNFSCHSPCVFRRIGMRCRLALVPSARSVLRSFVVTIWRRIVVLEPRGWNFFEINYANNALCSDDIPLFRPLADKKCVFLSISNRSCHRIT